MPDLKTQLTVYLEHVRERVDADEILDQQVVGAAPEWPMKHSSPKSGVLVPSWVLAAAAGLVVFLVFGGLGLLVDNDSQTTALPLDGSTGLHVLPPEGAEPSMPATGELAASWWTHDDSPELFSTGTVYLYTDGRLIWNSYIPEVSYDGEWTTGWVQQRLNLAGVARIRDEILASGLFDPENPISVKHSPPVWGGVQLRRGNRTVHVYRGPENQEWVPALDHLLQRLRDLHSWLPDHAWQNRGPIMFIPSTYSVCLRVETSIEGRLVQPDNPADLLALLPSSSQDLIVTAKYVDYGVTDDLLVDAAHCYEMTAKQARALASTMYQEELPSDRSEDILTFTVNFPSGPPFVVKILFVPHGPHGPIGLGPIR